MDLEIITRQPETQTHDTPLLFIHGAWHAAWCWDAHFLPLFAEQGYTVHAVSLRGHGSSPNDRSIRFTRLRHYLADALQAAESITPRPVLIGHSLGGALVQKMLARIDAPAAVLMASVPPHGTALTGLKILRTHPLPFLKMNLTFSMQPLVATPEGYRWNFFSDSFPHDRLLEYYARLSPESYSAFLDLTLFDLPHPSKARKVPMLVLGGEKDTAFAPWQIERTARAYHAESHIFPGMTHALMLDTGWPDVAARILSFLTAHNL
jgi:pimeloyl-ACP methyl ester carboxylesterase